MSPSFPTFLPCRVIDFVAVIAIPVAAENVITMGGSPHLQKAMRAREGAKHLRWVMKELKKRSVRSSSLCPGGGVRVVHQNREDEKNSPEFFDID